MFAMHFQGTGCFFTPASNKYQSSDDLVSDTTLSAQTLPDSSLAQAQERHKGKPAT